MDKAHAFFRRVYDENFRNVVRSIRRFGVPARQSEEVAQEAFFKVWVFLDRYDPARSFTAWLMTIVYRLSRDALRLHAHRLEHLARQEWTPMDVRPNPEQLAVAAEAEETAVEILRELSDDEREVYLMHEVDDIAINDIAVAKGIPENTVSSRLHRARERFAAAAARRRAADGFRLGAVVPLLAPETLRDALRACPGGGDLEAQARVWRELERRLDLRAPRAVSSARSGLRLAGVGVLGFVLGAAPGGRSVASAPTAAAPMLASDARASVGMAAGPRATSESSAAAAPAVATDVGDADNAAARAPSRATMKAETALLEHARGALRSGQLNVAVRDLQKHRRAYPRGRLADLRQQLENEVASALAARERTGR